MFAVSRGAWRPDNATQKMSLTISCIVGVPEQRELPDKCKCEPVEWCDTLNLV